MNVIGIDVGGSTTKIVCVSNGKMLDPMQVKATDPLTSVYGAFGKYLSEKCLTLEDIDKIKVTGVGSTYIREGLYGIPTDKVNEFTSIGLGGLAMSGLEHAIIVSMGTGTAFVEAGNGVNRHMGGTGVGGGTLLGLGSKLLDVRNYESIVEMALKGDLDKVDLYVGELSKTEDGYMPSKVTAANFGKVTDFSTKEDIAAGLVNMVFQTVGMMSVFAAQTVGLKDIVLIGNLSKFPNIRELCKQVEDLHDVHFHVPEFSEYATAFGAALSNR